MTATPSDGPVAVQACVFTLGGEVLALDVQCVREVAVFDDWTTLPLAPPDVLGVANLRGEVKPIVDVGPLLGLPARRDERRVHTLVVVADGLEAALVIDGVTSLQAFEVVVDAAGNPYASWVLGLLRGEGRLIPLLDAARILGALRPAGRLSPAA